MIDKLKNISLLQGQSAAGINIEIISGEKYVLSYVILKKLKNEIVIDKSGRLNDDFEVLFDLLSSSVPVYLSIDGRGIVRKKIHIEDNSTDDSQLLNKVFPNSSLNEFYLQKDQINDNEVFISIGRQDLVDKLIKRFTDRKLFVVNLSFGPFSIQNVINIIKETENIIIDNYKLKIDNLVISEISMIATKENKEIFYSIADERVSSSLLLPFSSAFTHFVNPNIDNSIPDINFLQEEYANRQIFNYGGGAILVFLFILLMGNFMLFNHYRNKSNELSNRLSENEYVAQELSQKKTELESKEKFITEFNISSTSRFSFYADRIGNSLPYTIQLNKLDINPLQKKIKDLQKPIFNRGIIIAAGYSKNSTCVNSWIKILNEFDWIKQVNVLNYFQENLNSYGEFELEIILK